MTKRLDKIQARLIRKYLREGKTADWIIGWKRGWYAAGRQIRKT
jgi:hypothetical protein